MITKTQIEALENEWVRKPWDDKPLDQLIIFMDRQLPMLFARIRLLEQEKAKKEAILF